MNNFFNYKGNKAFRLLNIYERLNKGEKVDKSELAKSFAVSDKTIQRDIDDLRAYLSEMHFQENEISIKYDKSQNKYYLIKLEREWLTNKEVLAICKILLESRALCKAELNQILFKLLMQVAPSDKKRVEEIICNEQFYYVPLRHNKELLNKIWELSECILKKEIIELDYTRKDGHACKYEIKPVAIMFSEFYFYLITYMADDSKDFPTVFRIDRIEKFNSLDKQFHIPYKDKFNDGEFRKRVQFMYSGELRKVKFEYSGQSIEAVLDRLPTAIILANNDGNYLVEAEVYGNGIDIWIRSQGDRVRNIVNSQ
ncbi:MAG: helix-turn-helix transcriptional regulator [Aminipila sp.]